MRPLWRRSAGFRWFSWLTGVPLLGLLYASGIGGFWLVWDERALFSVTATAEWLDWANVLWEPFARNFVLADLVVDRLFTLFIFLHIGIPLALLLGMWIHVQRVSRPDTQPPRALALGMLAALVVLSLAVPVASHPPANVGRVPASITLDWFYLFPHPLMYATSEASLWGLALLALALLLATPWLQTAARLPPAVVSPADCNGCGRCAADCPYSAILLVPHPDKRSAPRMAAVQPALCAGCGICAGACPSATPFRSAKRYASGIDLPGQAIARLRTELGEALARTRDAIVVFGCDQGADVEPLRDGRTVTVSLACAGMLPPSFVEYALRNGASGVLVSGCRAGGCSYRHGQRWVEERMAGAREPALRASVPPERWRVVWTPHGALDELRRERDALRRDLVDTDQRASHPGTGLMHRS